MHTNTITPAQLDTLKRAAKAAKKQDPARTYNQHLNALAAAQFGVRSYHELRQLLTTAADPTPPDQAVAALATPEKPARSRPGQPEWRAFQRQVGMTSHEARAANLLLQAIAAEHGRSGRLEASVPLARLVPPMEAGAQAANSAQWLAEFLRKFWTLERVDGGQQTTFRTSLVEQWTFEHADQIVRFSVSPTMMALFDAGDVTAKATTPRPVESFSSLNLDSFIALQDPRARVLYMYLAQYRRDGETPWLSGADLAGIQVLPSDLALSDFNEAEFDAYVASLLGDWGRSAARIRVAYQYSTHVLTAIKFKIEIWN